MSGTSLRRRRGADYLSVRGNLPGDAGETLTWRVHPREQPTVIVFDGGLDVGTIPSLAGGLARPPQCETRTITDGYLLDNHSGHNAPEAVMRIGTVVIIVWLIIGAIAAGQRHYYNSSSTNCAKTSTIAVTIVAGPLNYVGVNPKISCPKPS